MTVTLELEPELEARVAACAEDRRVSVPEYLHGLIAEKAAPQAPPAQGTPHPRRARLDSPEEQERLRGLLLGLRAKVEAEEAAHRPNPDAPLPDDDDPIVEKFRRQGFRL